MNYELLVGVLTVVSIGLLAAWLLTLRQYKSEQREVKKYKERFNYLNSQRNQILEQHAKDRAVWDKRELSLSKLLEKAKERIEELEDLFEEDADDEDEDINADEELADITKD